MNIKAIKAAVDREDLDPQLLALVTVIARNVYSDKEWVTRTPLGLTYLARKLGLTRSPTGALVRRAVDEALVAVEKRTSLGTFFRLPEPEVYHQQHEVSRTQHTVSRTQHRTVPPTAPLKKKYRNEEAGGAADRPNGRRRPPVEEQDRRYANGREPRRADALTSELAASLVIAEQIRAERENARERSTFWSPNTDEATLYLEAAPDEREELLATRRRMIQQRGQ